MQVLKKEALELKTTIDTAEKAIDAMVHELYTSRLLSISIEDIILV